MILVARHDMPGMLKMLWLAEQIERAAAHGALELVTTYLRGLPENE
jgi:hypothetical protein